MLTFVNKIQSVALSIVDTFIKFILINFTFKCLVNISTKLHLFETKQLNVFLSQTSENQNQKRSYNPVTTPKGAKFKYCCTDHISKFLKSNINKVRAKQNLIETEQQCYLTFTMWTALV